MTVEPRFFNRELSWLEFNQRVLDEASDQSLPLLERLKFLAITASNLDEFTMVRVGSLQILQAEGEMRPDPVGLTTSQQLKAIGERMQAFLTEQYRCFLSDIEPALAKAGMNRLQASQLNDRQLQHVQTYFDHEVFPILTPLAIVAASESSEAANIELQIAKRKGKKKKVALAKSPDSAADPSGAVVEPTSLVFPR